MKTSRYYVKNRRCDRPPPKTFIDNMQVKQGAKGLAALLRDEINLQKQRLRKKNRFEYISEIIFRQPSEKLEEKILGM